jgi:hypothetical protein
MTNSWTQYHQELQTYAQNLDPSIRLYTKNHWTHKIFYWTIMILSLSLAKSWLDTYMKRFGTTLAHGQFYPESFTYAQVRSLIPHESGHTREFRIFGLGLHPLLGLPGMAIKYLLLPLPVLLAFGRAHSEIFAEKYSWSVQTRETDISPNWIRWKAEYLANSVSGPMYLWSIPRSWCVKWYLKEAERFLNEIQSDNKRHDVSRWTY